MSSNSIATIRLTALKKRGLFYSLLCLITICVWYSPESLLREIALPAIFFYFPVSLCHLITTLLSGNTPSIRLSRQHIIVLNTVVALTGAALIFFALLHHKPIIAQIGTLIFLAIPEMYLTGMEDMPRPTARHDNPSHQPMTARRISRARVQHYCGIALILAGAYFAPTSLLWSLVGHPALTVLVLSVLSWIALTHCESRMAASLRHQMADGRIKWLYPALFLAAMGLIGMGINTGNEGLPKIGVLLLLSIFELHLLHKELRAEA